MSAWGTETTFPNPVITAFALRLARIAESPLTATQKTQATNELVVNKIAYTAKFAWVGQQVLHSMAKTIREHVRAWWRVHNLPSAMIEAEREVGGVGIINIEARWHVHVEYLCTFVYALTSHDEHVRAAAWETILSLTSRTAAQRSTQVIINCTGIWIADANAMSMEANEISGWTASSIDPSHGQAQPQAPATTTRHTLAPSSESSERPPRQTTSASTAKALALAPRYGYSLHQPPSNRTSCGVKLQSSHRPS